MTAQQPPVFIHSRIHIPCGLLLLLSILVTPIAHTEMPRCTVISGRLGGPAIQINGKPYSPLILLGNNQFKKDDIIANEIRQAAAAGINIFGFKLDLASYGSNDQAAQNIDQFCQANPDGYFLLQVWLGPEPAWTAEHPDDCITIINEKGERKQTGLASLASPAWREITAKRLCDRVRQVMEGPHGPHFIGVCLNNLQTGEWFYPDTDTFFDYSPANLNAFRDWLKKEYRSEKKLQQAWNQPNATFDTIQLPLPQERDQTACGPFRDPAHQQPAIDMTRFQADTVADTIAFFAASVKKITDHRALVGTYYGYTFQLNYNSPRALTHSGHLALAKLLNCPDIDLINAPHAYMERGLGESGHFHQPVDSIALHGKLHITEQDMYTHSATKPDDELIAPGWQQRTKSLDETLALVFRDGGRMANHRTGTWFFDLLSDGRWSDPDFWREIPTLRRIMAELRTQPPFAPEIAFIADELSPCYLGDNTHPYLVQSLGYWLAEIDRLGAPVGFYLQSDLPRLPDSIKVIIMADPFHMTKTERSAILKRLNHGASVIWNYAPDLIGPEGIDLNRITDLTGITVEAKFDDIPMIIKSEITDEEITVDQPPWKPRFIVTTTEGSILARYKQTGETAALAIPKGKGVSIYTATPRLPISLLREICTRSDVQLYSNVRGMTAVAGQYLIVHTPEKGLYQFAWPTPWKTIERIFPTGFPPIPGPHSNTWVDRIPQNTTVIYRITGQNH